MSKAFQIKVKSDMKGKGEQLYNQLIIENPALP
jgi:hypothetical protein